MTKSIGGMSVLGEFRFDGQPAKRELIISAPTVSIDEVRFPFHITNRALRHGSSIA